MTKLFEADAALFGRPAGPSQQDAVPEALAGGTPETLKDDLVKLLGQDRVLNRLIDLVRYASDASPYRLIPQVVVMPRNVEEMAKLFAFCRATGRHATFRAGGTSLNGQSQSDDILIDVRRHWYGGAVLDNGQRFKARPGLILSHANAMLHKHRRKLGPDPASEAACTIGGVIANNSGGMRCTLERDAYHTVESMTILTPSGNVFDTAAPGAEARFIELEPEFANGLLELRAELLADEALVKRIRQKYSIRNTHGYHIAALLDGTTPLEIYRLLLVGSEGTLGFIAEAVMSTIPVPAVTSVAWLPFATIDEAVNLVPNLVALGAAAVELMVAPALVAAGKAFPGTPSYWTTLDPKAAALLVEFGADSDEDLLKLQGKVTELVADQKLISPLTFTSVAEAVELAWHVREGLLGLVGKQRPQGAMLITEDVCFPPARLAEGAHDLQALMDKHGFGTGVAGHAAHGNLHFNLVTNLEEDESKKRYAAFMTELVDLIVNKYDGSLKAEHGTGLNMAPFVEQEWGRKATDMMWRIKKLADPQGILAPNVILTRDNGIHLKSLKSIPAIENVRNSTQCIECGFCEPVCPSRNATTTPRQRIALRREMARQPEGSAVLQELQAQYEYMCVETCAGDGTCAIPCPIEINTGALMREFRHMQRSEREEEIALSLAKRWRAVEKMARGGLAAAEIVSNVIGVKSLTGITALARSAIANDLMPSVPGPMPQPARKLPKTTIENASAVYFPACINRMFGRDPDKHHQPSLPETLVELSKRAGRNLWIPEDVAGLCCSTPFSSKGYHKAHSFMAAAIADAMWRWSDGGKLPIVVDAASCTLGIAEDVARYLDEERKARHDQLKFIDVIQWCHDLLPDLEVQSKLDRIAMHPTCSMTHLGLNKTLREIGSKLADDVFVPIGTTCCGTAGDRGLLHPEIVISATREEKAGLDVTPASAYISSNRTCEMGLRHATGRPYESFVFLLEELTRASAAPAVKERAPASESL